VEPASIPDLVERALRGYTTIADLAETVEEEWTYVDDLRAAWRARLVAVAAARSTERATPELERAVDALIDEVSAIEDEHRAIDWLSTFPQVLLTALGEPS
jgi:hypothetical protein